MLNRQLLLKERPHKQVTRDHFTLVESELTPLKDGDVRVKVNYLSFEPAQRGWLNDVPSYIPAVEIGEVMRAVGVGEIIESKHPQWTSGMRVQGGFGWQEYYQGNGSELIFPIKEIADGVPETYPLDIFGLTGLTAYFGMLDIGQPKEGDTVVISGAAGATGSVAGQIAKLKGCRVIGIAGGEAKCRWIKDELGFDEAIDYRDGDVSKALKALCRNSVNVFFDNVGGDILDAVLGNLALKARVVLCGGISSGYTGTDLPPGPEQYMQLVIRRSRMEGFLVLDYVDRYESALEELQAWVEDKKISVKEDIVEGLESCPDVLAGLFSGKNFGKQLVKLTR